MNLRAVELSHSYDDRVVLNGLSVEVKPGQVVGLLGPNGAGKSTAIGLMAGGIRLKHGQVWLGEQDLSGLPSWARVRLGLGLLPQQPSVLRDCTVKENLSVAASVSGLSDSEVDHQIQLAGLRPLMNAKAGTLSGGERRRLEIARCLVTRPKILLMDEPFSGVDPVGIENLQATIEQLADAGLGILITDHAVHATLGVCHTAIILDHGSVMAEGCPDAIVENPMVRDRYLGVGFRL